MADEATKKIRAAIFPKICAIIILPVASTMAGLLPLVLGKRFYKQTESGIPRKPTMFDKTMSFFLYFGGGVLLCTIFLHLLPEIHEDVDKLEEKGIYLNKYTLLSFPELILCVGFFMIFFIEQVMHLFLIAPASKKAAKTERAGVFVVERIETFVRTREEDGNLSGSEQEHINNLFDGNKNYHSCTEQPCFIADHNDKTHPQYHAPSNSHANDHDHMDHSHIPDAKASLFYGLLTVVALSTHELFEGLAVGLAPTASDVWYLLTAICCHKVVLAGFIGVQLLVTEVRTFFAHIYVYAFASTSPIGIAIGLVMSTHAPMSDALSIVSVTLQALAAGTLMYIAFFEIYAKQFGTYRLPGILKLVSSVAGFFLMSILQIELDS